MWFLLRAGFWIGLVLVVMPRHATLQDFDGRSAIAGVTSAWENVQSLCMRRPLACKAGGEALRLTRSEAHTEKEQRRQVEVFADGFSDIADRLLALRGIQAS